MAAREEPFLGYFPEAELVFALVCPLGTDHSRVVETLANYLDQCGYGSNRIRLSEQFSGLCDRLKLSWSPPADTDKAGLADYKIEAGNRIRNETKKNNILALIAAGLISASRMGAGSEPDNGEDLPPASPPPFSRTAHIISTLKRPEEVTTLRRIYGSGFFLIGLDAPKQHKERYFRERGIPDNVAADLMAKDAAESFDYGQLTRETFHLSDIFVSAEGYGDEIERFVDLVFGSPFHTPRPAEQAMFMAYAASLRSGDLSRQVGAAIVDPGGDLISVGCNDVPRFGGGLYGPDFRPDHRDLMQGYDSNERERDAMIERVLAALDNNATGLSDAKKRLKPTGLTDITEFGRSVHAEMEALLVCARAGRPVRGATLYTTTFPCHNCCRHIIGAGISRVVYIEPYTKSRALELHGDAISVNEETAERVPFVPFIGVGPRRYFDLFSLTLSTGYPVERKENGKRKEWSRAEATPRLQMQPNTYLDRERLAWEEVNAVLSGRSPNGKTH